MTKEEKRAKLQKIIGLSKDIKELIDEINKDITLEEHQEIIDVIISASIFRKGYDAHIHLNDSTGFVNLENIDETKIGNVLYKEKYSNLDECYVFSLS